MIIYLQSYAFQNYIHGTFTNFVAEIFRKSSYTAISRKIKVSEVNCTQGARNLEVIENYYIVTYVINAKSNAQMQTKEVMGFVD